MHSSVSSYENASINGRSSTLHPQEIETVNLSGDRHSHHSTASGRETLIILDRRALDRECFAESIITHGIGMQVVALASIGDWKQEQHLYPPLGVIVLSIGGRKVSDPDFSSELAEVTAECPDTPVVVLADSNDLDQILLALEKGIRGYIPTSVGVQVCIGAIALALAGGTFVPASSVTAVRQVSFAKSEAERPMASIFTQRQEEVAKALRRGKANKIIAYELNLRESTVKVHIRNIMKKLNATNRTEVAYKISELLAAAPPQQN